MAVAAPAPSVQSDPLKCSHPLRKSAPDRRDRQQSLSSSTMGDGHGISISKRISFANADDDKAR